MSQREFTLILEKLCVTFWKSFSVIEQVYGPTDYLLSGAMYIYM